MISRSRCILISIWSGWRLKICNVPSNDTLTAVIHASFEHHKRSPSREESAVDGCSVKCSRGWCKSAVRVRNAPISKWVLGNWRKFVWRNIVHENFTCDYKVQLVCAVMKDPQVLFAGIIFSQQSWRSHRPRRKRIECALQCNLIIEFLFAFSIPLLRLRPETRRHIFFL